MSVSVTSLARGRVRAFCGRGLDAETFRRELRARLHAVLPFDAYCVNTADPASLAITTSVGDGLSAEEASLLFAIEARGLDANRLCDLARAGTPVATIGPRPERSERMRALFLPRGWVDELRAALVERGRCWGYLHLFRATLFTRADVTSVAKLVPALALALRVGVRPRVATPPQAPEPLPGVLVFSRTGQIVAQTRAAAEALSTIPRDAHHGGPPHAIVDVARTSLARGGAAESHVVTGAGVLRLVATTEAECAVVVLERARPGAAMQLALACHRISRREEDVCRAMLRGLSDDEIAANLGVGTQTVKSHAKALFAKLEVVGRRGLLAKMAAVAP